MAQVVLEKYDIRGKLIRDITVSPNTARNLINKWPNQYKQKDVGSEPIEEIQLVEPPKKKDVEPVVVEVAKKEVQEEPKPEKKKRKPRSKKK